MTSSCHYNTLFSKIRTIHTELLTPTFVLIFGIRPCVEQRLTKISTPQVLSQIKKKCFVIMQNTEDYWNPIIICYWSGIYIWKAAYVNHKVVQRMCIMSKLVFCWGFPMKFPSPTWKFIIAVNLVFYTFSTKSVIHAFDLDPSWIRLWSQGRQAFQHGFKT